MVTDALRAGVRLVHLGTEPSSVARLPVVMESARRAEAPTDLVMMVSSTPGPGTGSTVASREGAATAPSTVRLHLELPFALLERPEGRAWVVELEAARDRGRISSWGVGLARLTTASSRKIRADAATADWVRAPYHLLSSREVAEALDGLTHDGVEVLGSDPYAAGRLDGRFLAESYLDGSPRAPAPELERLKREWAPVLQLGFLTGPHRTLPGAALAYLREHPGLRAVLVDARDSGELERAVHQWRTASLSAEERRRVDALRD
jgi:aryl-alcohol dehydrogenase-like predicted oxidoreductase